MATYQREGLLVKLLEGVTMKCLFCDEKATCCIVVNEGDKPSNPNHEGTQADHRRIVVRHACHAHRARIGLGSGLSSETTH